MSNLIYLLYREFLYWKVKIIRIDEIGQKVFITDKVWIDTSQEDRENIADFYLKYAVRSIND